MFSGSTDRAGHQIHCKQLQPAHGETVWGQTDLAPVLKQMQHKSMVCTEISGFNFIFAQV